MFRANIYGPLDGERLYYNFATGSFHTKKLCSRLYSFEIEFYFKVCNNCFLSHPLGTSGCALDLYLMGKPAVDFLFVIMEFFSLSLTVEMLQA